VVLEKLSEKPLNINLLGLNALQYFLVTLDGKDQTLTIVEREETRDLYVENRQLVVV